MKTIISIMGCIQLLICNMAWSQSQYSYRFEYVTPRLLNATTQQLAENNNHYLFIHQDTDNKNVVISRINENATIAGSVEYTMASVYPSMPDYITTPTTVITSPDNHTFLFCNNSVSNAQGTSYGTYFTFTDIDSSGTPVASRAYQLQYASNISAAIREVTFNSDSTAIYACGNLFDANSMLTYAVVLKMDLSGTIIWNRLVALNDNYIAGIISDNNNNCYLIENGMTTISNRISKWSDQGNLIFQKVFNCNTPNSRISVRYNAFHTTKQTLGLTGTYSDLVTGRAYPVIFELDTLGNAIKGTRYAHILYESSFSGIVPTATGGWMMRINKLTAQVAQNDGWRIGLMEIDDQDSILFDRFYLNWGFHYLDKNNYTKTKDGGYSFAGYDDNYHSYVVKTDSQGGDTCSSISVPYTTAALSFTFNSYQPVVESAVVTNYTPVVTQNTLSISSTILCIDSVIVTTGIDDHVSFNHPLQLVANVVNSSNPLVLMNKSFDVGSYQIVDVVGKLIQTGAVIQDRNSISISNQANGIYFINVKIGATSWSQKFVISNN